MPRACLGPSFLRECPIGQFHNACDIYCWSGNPRQKRGFKGRGEASAIKRKKKALKRSGRKNRVDPNLKGNASTKRPSAISVGVALGFRVGRLQGKFSAGILGNNSWIRQPGPSARLRPAFAQAWTCSAPGQTLYKACGALQAAEQIEGWGNV